MNIKDLVIVAVGLGLLILVMFTQYDKKNYVRYDCSISEISPDYPIEVKEACRKMRSRWIQ